MRLAVFRSLVAGLIGLGLAGCQTTSDRLTFDSADYRDGPPQRVAGLLFRPAGEGPRPAVVLLHTCGGLTPHMREDWPQFLTGLGYVVFSVDTLGSRGKTSCTQLQAGYYKQAIDAYHALDHLAALPFVDSSRVAVMGFSLGAIAINTVMAHQRPETGGSGEFRAAIALYGRCSPGTDPNALRFPLLEIVAEFDEKHAPICRDIPAGDKYRVEVLDGAYHAFDQPQITQMRNDSGGSRMIYDGAAAAKARALTRDFLASRL